MLAVVRVRGSIGVSKDLKYTLKLLRLNRVNHLVLLPETRVFKGMVKKVESFVTFGEINVETLSKLLKKRARLSGNKKIDESFLKKFKINSFEELAKKLIDGKISLKELKINPVFRLHPPRKGFERGGIKKPYSVGGALGYRASDINLLINRMI
jgi:large subunit ribosomal protein L30